MASILLASGALSAAAASRAWSATASTGAVQCEALGSCSAGYPPIFQLMLQSGAISPAASAGQFAMVALNSWQSDLIPGIRAANPRAKILEYRDLSSTRSYTGPEPAELPAGVSYAWANANHPDWFLTSSSGQRLQFAGYPADWEMDVGNPSYQAAWLANVEADVRAHGWDGVFMDDVLTAADSNHPGVVAARYPADASFQAAMRSMLAAVGPQLTQAGIMSVANIGGSSSFPGLWSSWVSLVTGGYEEHFVTWPGGGYSADWAGAGGWRAEVSELSSAQAQGKLAIMDGMGDTGDTRAFRYSFASFLMASNGQSLYAYQEDPAQWHPEEGWNLGPAIGAYREVGASLFERAFTAGLALVNASATQTETRYLSRPYIDENGRTVTSITLAPTSGAVLRVASGSPPPSAAPGTGVVVSDGAGGIATYGAVGWYGSAGSIHLSRPVVGAAATPDGRGYWMVASDGGVFTFGDARFYGSTGAIHLNRPVVGMAATPDGRGYWMVASDGGVFTFGAAGYHGSGSSSHLAAVALEPAVSGGGYWIVTVSGALVPFGNTDPVRVEAWGLTGRPVVGASTPR